MGSIQNPVGRGPRDPLEPTRRVDPVSEDKRNRHNRPQKPNSGPPDEKFGIFAFLLQAFNQLVEFVLEKSGSFKSSETQANKNLQALKSLFEILKIEDRSQDLQFLGELSTIWRQILEDSLHFKNDFISPLFKKLINNIQRYPENLPHTFGYYLSEYADQKWIPFPYMELIQTIHTEHTKNPTSSLLNEWTSIIDEIALLLKPE
ncbi:MAG: hypothetical protein COT85_04265 [Chlamydiae bacterium CG10_big_fil_rev_8_21_14_0_10_42_34]|nr:MAG: hypothetical protein COT85_04265 [Chlamydiae bacterium CG10_big_fil_rev_8_21_14_0_10_42_34]